MKKILSLLLLFTLISTSCAKLPDHNLPWDEESRLLMHISYLASDLRDGRGIGTDGLDSSAQYIARRFADYGLEPLFEDSYKQVFTMNWGASLLPGCGIFYNENDSLRLGFEYMPVGFSGDGEISASIVFAGYGITAPEYEYDDYEDVDVEGKVVIVLEGEPAQDDEDSRFEGETDTDHYMLRAKVINAKTHGAVGLLIITDNLVGDRIPYPRTDEPYRDSGIPAAYITAEAAGFIAPRLDATKAKRSIDANETPRSMDLGDTEIQFAVHLERNAIPVSNVGAVLPGTKEEVIVIGAHYDHLGYGQNGTREYGVYDVHNGADDNGSGVSVLLEMARLYSLSEYEGPSLWFVGFTAEEVGLVGSNHLVNNPPEGFENIKFMLNLDMFGRIEEHRLTAYGVHSAEGLKEMAEGAAKNSPLDLSYTGGGYGASDHTSFYTKGIPVIHLMGTLHDDYHTTRDDIDRINSIDLINVLNYSMNLVYLAGLDKTRLEYKESTPPKRGGRRGLKVSMGTIPDFSQPDDLTGFRIQGVREGSPADMGGLQGMDIIIKMDDVIIDNIYDFTFILKRRKPGDTIQVKYLRDGEELETSVTLVASSGKGHGRGGSHPGGKEK
jgi:hypothetical protein